MTSAIVMGFALAVAAGQATTESQPEYFHAPYTLVVAPLTMAGALTVPAGKGFVVIHFDTGKVDIPASLSTDAAAEAFWKAVEKYAGSACKKER